MRKILILLSLLILAANATAQSDLKRYQYDEILHGISVPQLITFAEIATYYQTTSEDLLAFNQRFGEDFDTTNLYYGQPIRMRAGLLMHAPNLAHRALSKSFQGFDAIQLKEGMFFELDTLHLDSIGIPITDTLAQKLIDPHRDFADQPGQWAYAVGKYNLPQRHYAYLVAKKRSNKEVYLDLMIFFYSDMVGVVHVAAYREDEDGLSWVHAMATDYDGDEDPDIIIESDQRNPVEWDYRSAFFTYELYLFQHGTLESTYLKAPFEVLWKEFHRQRTQVTKP